ncbi:hypothetical protein GGG16DRAFT_123032 [Schizophyllum commune]
MMHPLKNIMRRLFHKPRPLDPRTASYATHNPLSIDEYQALEESDRYTPAGLQCRKKASVERLRPEDLQQPPNPPENSASRSRRSVAATRAASHVTPAEAKRQSAARSSTVGRQSTSGPPAYAASSSTPPRPIPGDAPPTAQSHAGERHGGQRRPRTRHDPLLADRPSGSRYRVCSRPPAHVAPGSGRPSKQRSSDNGRSRDAEPSVNRAQEQSRDASTSRTPRHQPTSHRIAQLPRLWRGVSFAPSSAATGAEVGDFRLISIDEDERLDASRGLTRVYSWSSLVDCFSFLWHATNISSLVIGHLMWPMMVHALSLRRPTVLKTDVPMIPLLMGLSVRRLVRLELLLLADENAYAAFFDGYSRRTHGKASFFGTTSGHVYVVAQSIIGALPRQANWEVIVDA